MFVSTRIQKTRLSPFFFYKLTSCVYYSYTFKLFQSFVNLLHEISPLLH